MKDDKVAQLNPTPPSTINKRTVKLSRPLQTHKGAVTELVLEEPRAELLMKWGLPWRQIVMTGPDGGQKFEIEYIPDKMIGYIEAMSGIDMLSLEAMSARDMNGLFVIVTAMLQPGGSL